MPNSILNGLNGVTNAQLWNLCRNYDTNFKKHTSEATSDYFNEKSFEALKRTDINTIDNFFEISLRVAFQMLNVSKAKNVFENKGLVQVYNTPQGGYTQRITITDLKPVNPQFIELVDGSSVDPYIIRKPKVEERFFEQNFNFQNCITLQEDRIKRIFIMEDGMSSFISGVMSSLETSYKKQECVNIYNCLDKILTSNKYPMQDSQIVEVKMADSNNPTNDELASFILSTQDLLSAMDTSISSTAFNSAKFNTYVESSDLVMLIRPQLKNRIKVNLRVGAYNPEDISIPLEQIEVQNFGGLEPYSDAAFTTPVNPHYGPLGEQDGWTTTAAPETILTDDQIFWKDPHADVLAMIVQKGIIFENKQNPYEVQTAGYNPRGRYITYFANVANNSIVIDNIYTAVAIKSKASK